MTQLHPLALALHQAVSQFDAGANNGYDEETLSAYYIDLSVATWYEIERLWPTATHKVEPIQQAHILMLLLTYYYIITDKIAFEKLGPENRNQYIDRLSTTISHAFIERFFANDSYATKAEVERQLYSFMSKYAHEFGALHIISSYPSEESLTYRILLSIADLLHLRENDIKLFLVLDTFILQSLPDVDKAIKQYLRI